MAAPPVTTRTERTTPLSFPQRVDARGQLSNPCKAIETLAVLESNEVSGRGGGLRLGSKRSPRGPESAVKKQEDSISNPAPEQEVAGSPRQRQRHLSPAQASDLVAAYQAGMKIRELAARFNVNRTTVLAHVERARVPRHSDHGKWDDTMLAEAASLYEQAHSLAAIGQRFGVHAKTVASRLRQAGVQRRPRRGPA